MTLRANGSYIGPRASAVSTTAASGVWDFRTAQRYQEEAAWPIVFSPAKISGLQAWYDLSDATTVTDSGGNISQVDDKSGNDYHLAQATAALKPTYETAAVNGLNVLTAIEDASANRQTVSTSNASLAAIGGADFTVATVARMNTVGGSTGRADFFLWDTGGLSSDTVLVRFNNDTNDFRIFFRDAASDSLTVLSSDNLWSADQLYVLITTVSGSTVTVYQNNAQVATGSNAAVGPAPSFYSICRPLGGSSASISVGEQVIYNSALSASGRTLLYDYLAAKWGIS